MSVQTVRPSALPLPKSLSSSAPSVASSVSGTTNSKAGLNNDRPRAGSSTPPSNGPMSRSTIPVLYHPKSVAMIPRVAAAGLPHKNSHKTVGIPNAAATSININIKKPLNSPTSQPNQSYWRFGQSKNSCNTASNGSREIIRRHSARAASVSGDSGNVTPQQSSPVIALRKVSNASSTTDYGSRKVSTCSTDSNFSSCGRKISSDSNSGVKSSRKPLIGANSFGAADARTKKKRSINIANRDKSSSVSVSDELIPGSEKHLTKKDEIGTKDSVAKDGAMKISAEEKSETFSSSTSSSKPSADSKLSALSEVTTTTTVPGSSTSTTITVKTKDFRSKPTPSTNQSNERTTTRKTSTVKKSTTNQTKGPTKKRNTSSSSIVSNGKSNTPTSDKVVQPRTNNKKSNQDTSENCAGNNNQPDVIKAASAADKNVTTDLVSFVSKDIEILQQENEELDNQLKRHALGFEAMATMVDYLANHCGVVGVMDFNNKLKQDVMNLQHSLQNKKREIDTLKQAVLDQQTNIDRGKEKQTVSQAESNRKIQQLEKESKEMIEKLEYQNEAKIGRLREEYSQEIQSLVQMLQDEKHKQVVRAECFKNIGLQVNLNDEDQMGVSKIKSKEGTNENEHLTVCLLNEFDIDEWRRKEIGWEENKKCLENTINQLKKEIKDQNEFLELKNKGSASLAQSTQAKKLATITAEVESLKVVLEMRSEEIHNLRNENVRLGEKIEEYDSMKIELGRATAQAEDLKAQLNSRLDLERKLSTENRKLYNEVERETQEKKRLSMENEELHWKMRQSLDHSGMMSMSVIEGPSYSPFSSMCGEKEQPLNTTFPQMYQSLHIPSTHSSSHQYGQGNQNNTDEGEYETDELSSMPYQPPSLPLYAGGRTFTKGRRPGIKNLRPDSAPPGKFDGHNRSRVSGGEPHPMMTYYNSPQVQRSRECSPNPRLFGPGYCNFSSPNRNLMNNSNNSNRISDLSVDGSESPRVLEVVEKTDSLAWNLEFEGDEQAKQNLMTQSYHPQSSQAFKPALGATISSPGLKRKRSPPSPLAFRRGQNPPHLLNTKHLNEDNSIMARSLDSHSIWQTPPQPVPAWACKEPGQEISSRCKSPVTASHARSSNLINRASAVVQKRTPPSTLRTSSHSTTSTFATLSEEESLERLETVNNEEPHDSLEDGNQKNVAPSESPKPPQPIDLMSNVSVTSRGKPRGTDAPSSNNSNSKPSSEFEDDDEEEIGDISSSSEIEIDADQMAEVTTPQIEEMQAKMNSVFSRSGKQSYVNIMSQDMKASNECQNSADEEDDDEEECDQTLRESFTHNSKAGKSISIIAAVNKAKSKENNYKNATDKDQEYNTNNASKNRNDEPHSYRYSNSTDDGLDDGFSPSTNGEDENETDADDEIEEEGLKGSNRTPDSLLSPVSDDIPPAKGWV